MGYFSISKTFLGIPLTLDVKESHKIDKFLQLLDKSGIYTIIKKYIKNNTCLGGRSGYNKFKLFAVILFGFAFKDYSLRDLEQACKYDLRYKTIMEGDEPNYSTLCHFINEVIVPNEKEIFSKLMKTIINELPINTEVIYIDGSKFEANANKYKFVWKPITFHTKLSNTVFNIVKQIDIFNDYKLNGLVSSKNIIYFLEKLNEKENKSSFEINAIKALNTILLKIIEYEEKENICGSNRKSYYKTDKDATAMCLKADYYSGLGSNMHAAYNIQVGVSSGFILVYYVSQSRADINDFIPTIEQYYLFYSGYPKKICADAGYGSYKNYKYMHDNNIISFVKHQSWEGNLSGSNPEQFKYTKENKVICLNNNIGYEIELENRHPRKEKTVFFKVDGCNNCKFSYYCKRFMKDTTQNYKIFELNKEFELLKNESVENLLSAEGIKIRINRAIQVEGTFGNEKQNQKHSRLRRRGIDKVSTEIMLSFLGANIKKYFSYLESKKLPAFWDNEESIKPQCFKKPSAKRLNKKGKRIYDKTYKK